MILSIYNSIEILAFESTLANDEQYIRLFTKCFTFVLLKANLKVVNTVNQYSFWGKALFF